MSVPVLTHRRDLRQGDLVFPGEILRMPYSCGHGMAVSCAFASSLRDTFANSPICIRLNTVASTNIESLWNC